MLNEIKDQKNNSLEEKKFFSFIKKYQIVKVFLISLGVVLVTPLVAYGVLTVKMQQAENIRAKNSNINLAIDTNDYDLWFNSVQDKGLKEKITRENFSDFVLVYNLLKQGDIEGANAIKQTLGLKQSTPQLANVNQQIKNAIMARDYSAWRSLVGSDFIPSVSEENFDKYSNAYELAASGNIAVSSGILRSLNLKSQDFSSSR
jgi:hypothetical protein